MSSEQVYGEKLETKNNLNNNIKCKYRFKWMQKRLI